MAKNSLKQLKFDKINGWGGRRRGAGRPNLSGQVNHMKRPKISIKTPLHVTLRLKEKLPSIRNKQLLKEFKKCIRGAATQGLHVIHFSIQSNHIHLFCEAKNNKSISLGMRALVGRFAKYVRSYAAESSLSRRGSVFAGRYHLHILKTPREVKNALEYVLLNLSKHQRFIEYMDEFSSAQNFKYWRKLLGSRFKSLIKQDAEFWERQRDLNKNKVLELQGQQIKLRARKTEELQSGQGTQTSDPWDFLSPPQSWLAKSGWMRACE